MHMSDEYEQALVLPIHHKYYLVVHYFQDFCSLTFSCTINDAFDFENESMFGMIQIYSYFFVLVEYRSMFYHRYLL